MLNGKDLVQLYGFLTVITVNNDSAGGSKLKDTEALAKKIGHMLADAYDYSEEINQ